MRVFSPICRSVKLVPPPVTRAGCDFPHYLFPCYRFLFSQVFEQVRSRTSSLPFLALRPPLDPSTSRFLEDASFLTLTSPCSGRPNLFDDLFCSLQRSLLFYPRLGLSAEVDGNSDSFSLFLPLSVAMFLKSFPSLPRSAKPPLKLANAHQVTKIFHRILRPFPPYFSTPNSSPSLNPVATPLFS